MALSSVAVTAGEGACMGVVEGGGVAAWVPSSVVAGEVERVGGDSEYLRVEWLQP